MVELADWESGLRIGSCGLWRRQTGCTVKAFSDGRAWRRWRRFCWLCCLPHKRPPKLLEAQSAPAAPTGLSVSRADGTVTASWDAPAGATKYHVTYSTDGGGSWHAPVNDNVTATSITFSADNAKSYTVGVRAGNDHGQWSAWTNSPPAGPYTPPNTNPPDAVDGVTLSRSGNTLTAAWELSRRRDEVPRNLLGQQRPELEPVRLWRRGRQRGH